MMDLDEMPKKITPKKRIWDNKNDPERTCIILAIQPMMHTCYIKFLDTGEIVVTPRRFCKRIKTIPKKKLDEFF